MSTSRCNSISAIASAAVVTARRGRERPTPMGAADFDTTHWSMVLAAGHRSSPDSDKALASLCETYWYPLYAYVRRRIRDIHEAQDLTQEFFATLLEKGYLGVNYDPDGPRKYTRVLLFGREGDQVRG